MTETTTKTKEISSLFQRGFANDELWKSSPTSDAIFNLESLSSID